MLQLVRREVPRDDYPGALRACGKRHQTDITKVADGLYIASRFYEVDIWVTPFVLIECDLVMEDLEDETQGDIIDSLAHASQALWFAGFNVVLMCQAGRNRSAAVAARVLILRGETPERAVAAVRDARMTVLGPSVLTNRAFLAHLTNALDDTAEV